MKKKLTILLLLLSLIACLTTTSNILAQSNSEAEGVESVSFDKEKATLACPFGFRSNYKLCNTNDGKIMIKTVSPSAEKNGWNYYYFVTGGKIVGEGANVIWDFSNSKPGTYKVTIGVGKDGIIKGNYVSKMIMADSCQNCHPTCNCPGILVSGPTAVAKRGDTLIFTAEVNGGDQDRVKFNWIVSDGTIVFGQGTKQILVKTLPNMKASYITATFEVAGLCSDCQNTASATVKIK